MSVFARFWRRRRHPRPVEKVFLKRPGAFLVNHGRIYLDDAIIDAKIQDGWLYVTVEADPGIIAYAVTVNGKDLPFNPVVGTARESDGKVTSRDS